VARKAKAQQDQEPASEARPKAS